jgi:hypothetical protein
VRESERRRLLCRQSGCFCSEEDAREKGLVRLRKVEEIVELFFRVSSHVLAGRELIDQLRELMVNEAE